MTGRSDATAVRREVVERLSTAATAWSVSGRDLGFTAGFDSGIVACEFVMVATVDGRVLVAQVQALEMAERDGVRLELTGEALTTDAVGSTRAGLGHANVALLLRSVRGAGQILASVVDGELGPVSAVGFSEASIEPATDDVVAQLVAGGLGSSVGLDIGTVGEGGPPALLKAAGFARHTFMVGQSGSGKTYSLGVVLERLLASTTIPMVIIDPNSDYVHLGEAMPGAPMRPELRDIGEVVVARGGVGGDLSLRIHLSDLSVDDQAVAMGLDPFVDRDEYAAFVDVADELAAEPHYGVDAFVARLLARGDEWSARLLQRIHNLRIDRWEVFAATDEESLTQQLESARVVVLDTGSLTSARERSLIALAVMGRLRRRTERKPILLAIDEAHNLLPPESSDPLVRAVVDYGVWVAGEGRKYGIHMIVSTQRPQKIHRNVISQCDNLILMRMNSVSDIEELSTVFSHVAPSMIAEARSFSQGELIVAGPIATPALRVRTGARWSPEGGGDVPTTWATPTG